MNLIIFGPPGDGKGTQSNYIVEKYGLFQLSTGEILRNEIKNKTELGLNYRNSGCAALDMAYVANGRYDGYFQKNLNLWDIAAGIILINEAGGIIDDINLSYKKNIKVLSSNPNIYEKFKQKVGNF